MTRRSDRLRAGAAAAAAASLLSLWMCGCATTPPEPATSASGAAAEPRVPPPRVMTLAAGKGLAAAVHLEDAAIPLLLQKGVPVVDRGMVQTNIKKIQSILASAGDEQGAMQVGMEFGADVVLNAQSEAKMTASDLAGSKLRSYQGEVTVRAVATDDAQLLATATESANMIALDDATGAARAVQAAASKALQSVIPDMLDAWARKQKERKTARASGTSFTPSVHSAMLAGPATNTELCIPPPPAGYEPPVTAIWRITPQTGVSSNWVGPVTETLYSIALRSHWFRVVTREDMAKILAEHHIQMSEACDTTTRAVEFGKILNAQKLLIGTASRLGATYQIVLKLVNVESGEVERVGQAQARGNVDVLLELVKQAGADLFRTEPAATGNRSAAGGG